MEIVTFRKRILYSNICDYGIFVKETAIK